MKRSTLILAVLFALAILVAYLIKKPATILSGAKSTKIPSHQILQPVVSPSVTLQFANKRSNPTEPTLIALAPKSETYRAEVAKNPHATPPSFLRFAFDLATKFDQAVASPTQSQKFLRELNECVKDTKQETVDAIRALCLANVRRLGQKSPKIRSEAEAIWDGADSRIRGLVPKL